MMDLALQLRADGTEKGLCQEWQRKLTRGLSIKRMVTLFIRGIDFCISRDFPTLGFMREHFKGKSEPYGAYVDDTVQLKNAPDTVLNGDCKAFLEYDGYSVSRLFIRHTSRASVNAADHAYLTIDAFDDSYLAVAVAGSSARVIVNKYGNAKVDCLSPGIELNIKDKNTY